MLRTPAGLGAAALLACALLSSCKKKPADETGVASASAPPPSGSTAPSAGAAATVGAAARALAEAPMPEGETLSALDACMIGTWRSTLVTMKMSPLHADGGPNALLTISETGAAVLDFTPMSAISAVTPEFTLDFQYSGKASATLKTPRQGVLEVTKADFSALRVSALAKPPKGEPVVVFRNRSLTRPAPAGSAAPAPSGASSVEAAMPGVAGIAQDPALSSGQYSCGDSALMLRTKGQEVTWRFVKADPVEPPPAP